MHKSDSYSVLRWTKRFSSLADKKQWFGTSSSLDLVPLPRDEAKIANQALGYAVKSFLCPSRWGGIAVIFRTTLRAPLSGTFLQTLPDLVTPLKGHSLSSRCFSPTPSAPSERFGYTHVKMRPASTPGKKRVPSRFKRL